jgi:hypothetical protein
MRIAHNKKNTFLPKKYLGNIIAFYVLFSQIELDYLVLSIHLSVGGLLRVLIRTSCCRASVTNKLGLLDLFMPLFQRCMH